MLFAKYGQAILTLHERHSRILLAHRPPSKASLPIIAALNRMLEPIPQPLRQTLTFDNGTEFAQHLKLRQLGIATYFCDPHALGKKAASKTPSAACAAACRAKPTSPPSRNTTSSPSSKPTTTLPENASTITPQPKSSSHNCCTSNVNPPSGFRRNDDDRRELYYAMPLSASISLSSPDWNISVMMSQPPTNSPFT